MRRSAFGDIYCHTAEEVRDTVGDFEDIVAGPIERPFGDAKYSTDLWDGNYNLICFIEGDSFSQVRMILAELKLTAEPVNV